MRLSEYEQEAIKKVFLEIFENGKIYLFGSRVDDTKKGGDIDLYIEPTQCQNLVSKKIDFLVKLKNIIGDQKIDVVMGRGEDRMIDQIAKKEGVLLCKN